MSTATIAVLGVEIIHVPSQKTTKTQKTQPNFLHVIYFTIVRTSLWLCASSIESSPTKKYAFGWKIIFKGEIFVIKF